MNWYTIIKAADQQLSELSWKLPNFESEWEEVSGNNQYAKHFPDKSIWLEKAQSHGSMVAVDKDWEISNTDFPVSLQDQELSSIIEEPKMNRVSKLIRSKSTIELPILLRDHSGYTLIGGNTRLVMADAMGYTPRAWVIDIRDTASGKTFEVPSGEAKTIEIGEV